MALRPSSTFCQAISLLPSPLKSRLLKLTGSQSSSNVLGAGEIGKNAPFSIVGPSIVQIARPSRGNRLGSRGLMFPHRISVIPSPLVST